MSLKVTFCYEWQNALCGPFATQELSLSKLFHYICYNASKQGFSDITAQIGVPVPFYGVLAHFHAAAGTFTKFLGHHKTCYCYWLKKPGPSFALQRLLVAPYGVGWAWYHVIQSRDSVSGSYQSSLQLVVCPEALLISTDKYKKLCRCRGTARRATNTKYRTWKACNRMNVEDTQGHYNIAAIRQTIIWVSLAFRSSLVLQHIYLAPFLRYYHFSSVCDCLWPWEVLHLWL